MAEEKKKGDTKMTASREAVKKPVKEKPKKETPGDKPVKEAVKEKALKEETDKPSETKEALKEAETKAEEKKEPAKKKEKKPNKEKVIEKIKYTLKDSKAVSDAPESLIKSASTKKKTKPRFMRAEYPKVSKKLEDVWRRPRGIDSKQHEGKRGKPRKPGIGYGKPSLLRSIHPSGYKPVLIRNKTDLKVIDPGTQAAVIASNIGRLKRNEIIRIANESKIVVLNPRKGEV